VVHHDRRKSRGQPRILYWFRTPPGVRVGRAALDEDAIRQLEESNPGIEFDWTRILKGQPDAAERRAAQPLPAQPPPSQPAVPDAEEPPNAAAAKLGSEGLARLRGRYSEMLARIDERITDPDRQAELKTLAERLNPDAWVTESDVVSGLDAYEATFESLRSVVGRGHRRGRRSKREKVE
jgi:hypothetical protein